MLLHRILDFPERDVEHAMIPRSQVDAVPPTTTVGEIRELMAGEHSRYPVLGEDDRPVGVVDLSDVLDESAPAATPVTDVMRAPLVVPETMTLTDVLEHLHGTHNELACVIDEYGGFTGVITIEDLAEELVGEIHDEHDEDIQRQIDSITPGQWCMDGGVHLDEVERAIGAELPVVGDVETLAGLIIAEHGALPTVGQTVTTQLPADPRELVEGEQMHRELVLEVMDVENFVPSEVRVSLNERPVHDGESAATEEEQK